MKIATKVVSWCKNFHFGYSSLLWPRWIHALFTASTCLSSTIGQGWFWETIWKWVDHPWIVKAGGFRQNNMTSTDLYIYVRHIYIYSYIIYTFIYIYMMISIYLLDILHSYRIFGCRWAGINSSNPRLAQRRGSAAPGTAGWSAICARSGAPKRRRNRRPRRKQRWRVPQAPSWMGLMGWVMWTQWQWLKIDDVLWHTDDVRLFDV